MMAGALRYYYQCVSSPLGLQCMPEPLHTNDSSSSTKLNAVTFKFRALSFASPNLLSRGLPSIAPLQKPLSSSTVCKLAPTKKSVSAAKHAKHTKHASQAKNKGHQHKKSPKSVAKPAEKKEAPAKQTASVAKRARQANKRRLYNKSRISEVKTRVMKVLKALEVLKKRPDPLPEEVRPIEGLIAEAYSAIDKSVKVGIMHRNTGARRKSRLARNKTRVEKHHGWYTPIPAAATV